MWIIQPLLNKSGFWRACASSDEDGGFHEGCQHEHSTEAEAGSCLEAKITLGGITGFPDEDLSLAEKAYDAYCEHAGWKSLATGQDLPRWSGLRVPIKAGWLATARALKASITSELKERISRA